jgi:hypothetical protein
MTKLCNRDWPGLEPQFIDGGDAAPRTDGGEQKKSGRQRSGHMQKSRECEPDSSVS